MTGRHLRQRDKTAGGIKIPNFVIILNDVDVMWHKGCVMKLLPTCLSTVFEISLYKLFLKCRKKLVFELCYFHAV